MIDVEDIRISVELEPEPEDRRGMTEEQVASPLEYKARAIDTLGDTPRVPAEEAAVAGQE